MFVGGVVPGPLNPFRPTAGADPPQFVGRAGLLDEFSYGLRIRTGAPGLLTIFTGPYVAPTINVALEQPITCAHCGNVYNALGAEELALNSEGACPECVGTGITRQVDEASLGPDATTVIDEGAVAPWNRFGFNV